VSPTEIQLLAVLKAPAVPLGEVCDRYLGLGEDTAYREAALNRLPFPTFRLTQSRKAPVMVNISDLARHIDEQHECAKKSWANSQV